ncbi:hypothetical protein FB451DRAFT_1549047 [Mycena latifolia]|nr:hypothetical protein FB451DRAFT_1549047 [Mycena latifolia]
MNPLRSLCLILGTLSAVHTVATSSIPWPAGRSSLRLGLAAALGSRQNDIPNVPPQCTSTCDPVTTILETKSCPPATCCMGLFQSDYFNCLECVGVAENATASDFAQAQALVDGLTVACSIEGFPLPELTLPGQNPNRTLATLSGSQTSMKATQSQITITALSATASSVSPSPTISQKTVTALPTSDSVPSSTPAPAPTTTTGAAVQHNVRFSTGLLCLIVAGWMMLL